MTSIDRCTGSSTDAAGCTEVFSETFLEGTEPTTYCSAPQHARIRLPYPFQRYPIDDDGALAVPAADLDRLLASEPGARLAGFLGRRLEVDTPDGTVSIPVHRTTDGPVPAVPPELEGKIDASAWRGHDGRPARVVLLRH